MNLDFPEAYSFIWYYKRVVQFGPIIWHMPESSLIKTYDMAEAHVFQECILTLFLGCNYFHC